MKLGVKDAAECRRSERAPDAAGERDRGGGRTEDRIGDGILDHQHQHLHDRAEPQAQDQQIQRRCDRARPDVQARQQHQSDRHQRGAEDRKGAVAPGPRDQPTRDDRRRQQADDHRQQAQARSGRRGGVNGLKKQRQKGHRPEQGEADDQRQRPGNREHVVAQQSDRHDRLGDATLGGDEGDEQRDPQRADQDHLGRAPRPGRPTQARDEHDRAERTGEQRCSDVVDRGPGRGRRRGQRGADHRQRHQPDRQVDVEDPSPRHRLHDQPAQQRAADARDAEHRAEQSLVAPPFARRHDVADHRLNQDDEPARAQALHGAEADQLGHRMCLTAQRGPRQEHDDRALRHALAPVEIAQLAVDRSDDGLGEQERARDPGQAIQATEVRDDRRQRGGHDRLIECGQQ